MEKQLSPGKQELFMESNRDFHGPPGRTGAEAMIKEPVPQPRLLKDV